MRRIGLTVFLLFSVVLSTASFLRGDKPEIEFPQLSSDVNYEDVTKRIEWMSSLLMKGESFHKLLDHPGLERVNHVPNYEGNVIFFFRKYGDKQYRLGTVGIDKISPKRGGFVHVGHYESGNVGFYKEFMLGHIIVVAFYEAGKPRCIDFQNLIGERKIEFNEGGQTLANTYKQFDGDRLQARLENNKQMDNEIQASIKEGYTAIQKQSPKEWQLKMPEKLRDKPVRDRLTKIEEYRQAIVAGNARPLVENQVFDKDTDDEMLLHVVVCFCGKNVSFVTVYKHENWRTIGYFMVFDEFSRLQKYVEGEIFVNQNLTGHEVAKSAQLHLRDIPLEKNRRASGLEITFHPTGYPASYRTIVKERLFGRLIEWNDKGEVVSDVDLDIPQPWPEAPKRADEEEKN